MDLSENLILVARRNVPENVRTHDAVEALADHRQPHQSRLKRTIVVPDAIAQRVAGQVDADNKRGTLPKHLASTPTAQVK